MGFRNPPFHPKKAIVCAGFAVRSAYPSRNRETSGSEPHPIFGSTRSETFVGLVAYAKSKGCWWINLDQDGDIESDIPTFDW